MKSNKAIDRLPRFLFALLTLTIFSSALAQDLPIVPKQADLFVRSYSLPMPADVLVNPWMASVIDFNADGEQDIIVYGHHSKDAFIWYGARGDAQYLTEKEWIFGTMEPLWIDADDDGDLDAYGTAGRDVAGNLFINDGTGSFVRSGRKIDLPIGDHKDVEEVVGWPPNVPRSRHPLAAKFQENFYVDLNGDGVDERVINFFGRQRGSPGVNPGYKGYGWIIMKRQGLWEDVSGELGLDRNVEQLFFPEDVDVDGDLDILDTLNGYVYLNDEGRFSKSESESFYNGNTPWEGDGELELLDLDNNGYRDLVMGADHSTRHGIYMNMGGGKFSELSGSIVPFKRRTRKFADMDNDGDFDLVVFDNSTITVWENKTRGTGVFLTFEGDLLGQALRVEQNGELVHYRQLIQERRTGRKNVLDRHIHIGNVDLQEELIILRGNL